MSKTKVLIVGSTGRVGSAAIEHLLARDAKNDLEVFGGVRTPEKAALVEQMGATPVLLDLDDRASVDAAVQGMDRLLLLTGYSVEMLRQSKRILDAAHQAGVEHVVHIGASGHPTAEVAHWGWHRMIEAYVESLGFSFTHVHPEAFMQNLEAFGWLSGGHLTSLIGRSRWSWVDAYDVGALAGTALAEPQKLHGRSIRMGYDAATMDDVARYLREQLELDVTVREQSPDAFYEAAVAAGADPAYLACVRDQFKMSATDALPEIDATFDAEEFRAIVGRAPARWPEFLDRERGNLLRAAEAAV